MIEAGWRWADAWIFVAAVIAGGAGQQRRSPSSRRPEGVRLTDILYMADYLNRSLPDRSDIEQAVRRLIGAGLITVDDGWFQITPTGRQVWRTRPPAGLGGAVETMRQVLLRRPVPADADWTLSEDEYATAVQEYTVRTAGLVRRRRMTEESPTG